MKGSTAPGVSFIDLMRDTIETHGLRWAVQHYSKRMPAWEFRFFIKQAYLGATK